MGRCRACCNLLVLATAVLVGLCLHQWPGRVDCTPYLCNVQRLAKPVDPTKDLCELTGDPAKDLEVKGYTIIKDYVPHEMLTSLKEVWETLPDDSVTNPGGNGGSNSGYKNPGFVGMDLMAAYPELEKMIMDMGEKVRRSSDIDAVGVHNATQLIPIFFTTNASSSSSVTFPWHQDAENYFYFQDLYNELAFYIIVAKPDSKKAGLKLLPFDAVKEHSPWLYETSWGGDNRLIFHDLGENKTYVNNIMSDEVAVLDFDVDSLACTPDLFPGDLVLFRGDVIHATQPHTSQSSWRTSLNVIMRPQNRVRLSHTLKGGVGKYSFMKMSTRHYQNYYHQSLRLHDGLAADGWEMRAAMMLTEVGIHAGHLYVNALKPVRHVIEGGLSAAAYAAGYGDLREGDR